MSTNLAERPRIFFCLTADNSNQSLTRKGANFLPKFLSAKTNLLFKPESFPHPRPQQRGTKTIAQNRAQVYTQIKFGKFEISGKSRMNQLSSPSSITTRSLFGAVRHSCPPFHLVTCRTAGSKITNLKCMKFIGRGRSPSSAK